MVALAPFVGGEGKYVAIHEKYIGCALGTVVVGPAPGEYPRYRPATAMGHARKAVWWFTATTMCR